MGRPSKYPRELRERAVRMVAELRPDYPSEYAAMTDRADARYRLAGDDPDLDPPQSGRRRRTPRRHHRGGGGDQATPARERRAAACERNIEGGFGFLRGRARPATEEIVTFIEENKDRRDGGLRWGVESICDVLTQHGVKVAPSTYYDARDRRPSARKVSDERWKPIILTTWEKQRKGLGARKLWLRLRRDGHDIAATRSNGSCGSWGSPASVRGKRKRPADTALRETRPADLVDRHFWPFRTDQLWVADFTYVWTWSGWVYVAFVFDAHSRRILGWRAATSMTTPLVLDCLDMALWTRRREGVARFAGLTHYTDAAASTRRSPSPTVASMRASTRRSGRSATRTTTRSRSRRSGSTSPSSSTTRARGGTPIKSKRRPRPGCCGSTPNAPTARSRTSHPSRSSSSTTLTSNRSREPADTSKQLSGHAGVSQSGTRS